MLPRSSFDPAAFSFQFAQFVRLTLVPAANALKITRFLVIPARLCVWPSYLCSGIPFHSSNWQTDVFHFQDRLYGTL